MVVLAQDDDRTFLEGLLEDNLSDAGRDVRVIGFAGALSSRATMQQMTIADDQGVWLTLNNAVLDWNRGALVRGRLEVNQLTAEELIVTRLPPSTGGADLPTPEATGFALPDLPIGAAGPVGGGPCGIGRGLVRCGGGCQPARCCVAERGRGPRGTGD